ESFECLKFYIFRLEYSLDDYKHRKIQWNFQTFRLTILLTIISWLNIAFIIYQYNQPNKFLLKSFKKLSRLFFECQHIDLLLLFIIIILIILEYHWFILIRKILHYKFRPNELFIKYLSKFNNQKLIIENRYLIRFIWIGNLMTKSLNFIIGVLSTFLSSNGLYLLLARLPYYNQNVCKKLLNLIANSQQRQRRKYSLFNCNRLFYLKQMIKSNLFVQKISTNQFGFTCGQIFFITRYKYLELFLMNFVLVLLFYKKIYLLNVTL
uniref:Uncharacterized protein LOC113796544 n=1 Tax=Dermatophagoides pteronyssinus TaxID=6956 RepID=A0A6P6YB92_DERPT